MKLRGCSESTQSAEDSHFSCQVPGIQTKREWPCSLGCLASMTRPLATSDSVKEEMKSFLPRILRSHVVVALGLRAATIFGGIHMYQEILLCMEGCRIAQSWMKFYRLLVVRQETSPANCLRRERSASATESKIT